MTKPRAGKWRLAAGRSYEGLDSRSLGCETWSMTTEALKKLSPAEKSEAARARLRAMGLHVPHKDEWKKSFGSMKQAEHFDEAIRLGAEWRAKVNRGEIEEGDPWPDADS